MTSTVAPPPNRPPRRRSALRRRNTLIGWTFILPNFAGFAAFTLVPVLILVLFVSALLQLEAGWLVVTIFCVSQVSLIGSMLAFIRDMNLSLAAVKLELNR